jgi:hypothetical protein
MKSTFLMFLLVFSSLFAARPGILVKNSDRSAWLDKIAKYSWARTGYEILESSIAYYVDLHQVDRTFLPSRFCLYWGYANGMVISNDGSYGLTFYSSKSALPDYKWHYTTFTFVPDQRLVTNWSGQASWPTCWQSTMYATTNKAPSGNSWKTIYTLKDLKSFPTKTMLAKDSGTGLYDELDYKICGTTAQAVNSWILSHAMQAGLMYWFTGQEKYARFGADLLSVFCQGAQYNTYDWAHRYAVPFTVQSIYVADYIMNIALAYDFLEPYMKSKGYHTEWVQTVISNGVRGVVEKGTANNNWAVVDSLTLVLGALALDDQAGRDYWMRFFLSTPYDHPSNANVGQKPASVLLAETCDEAGFWKETPHYHDYALRSLGLASHAADLPGYEVFKSLPILYKVPVATTRMAKALYK